MSNAPIRIRLPYHKTFVEGDIPSGRLRAVLAPGGHGDPPGTRPGTQRELVADALDHPIGCPRLERLAEGKKTATIITSDHTRPVPSRTTLPLLLERLRRNTPGIDIRILVATGCHRAPTPAEMREKFGEALLEREHFCVHDCRDRERLRFLGQLPSGGDLWLNREALDTDLLIAEGFIEPHFFAGFSGGRKSVLPGVAGLETVLANHCSAFIADPQARAGRLDENPIHRDMLFAARKAGLAFILNVILRDDHSIQAAFAGDSEQAHAEGCRQMARLASVPRTTSGVVITSNGGYPLDQNLYQAVKGMTAAEACCSEGGTIIMVAGCSDGAGGEHFYRALAEAESPQVLLEQIQCVSQANTAPDQWEYQILARILARRHVILVSDLCDPAIIRNMGMEHAPTLQEAIQRAFDRAPPGEPCTVIPDGVAVIVT